MAASSNELSSRFWGLRFQPPDPAWASRPLLARTRRELKRHDRFLNIWWCPNRGLAYGDLEMPGRWRIVRYGERSGGWKKWFYWQGPRGEYRHPFPVEPIVEKVKASEATMRRFAVQSMGELAVKVAQKNARSKEREKDEFHKEMHKVARDAFRFYMGRKIITGGPTNHIRSRAATRRAAKVAREWGGS